MREREWREKSQWEEKYAALGRILWGSGRFVLSVGVG